MLPHIYDLICHLSTWNYRILRAILCHAVQFGFYSPKSQYKVSFTVIIKSIRISTLTYFILLYYFNSD